MRKVLLFLAIGLSLSFSAIAQKGTVKGVVKDASTGEEVIGASVVIEGTTTGASTNVFGQFTFQVEAGEYNLISSFVGYTKFSQAITVTAGQVTEINISLASDAKELEAVEIVGKKNTESAGALMVERKKADLMVQSIGAEEMSVKGVSNVEDAATKMSGVSKVGSKGLFVRGLGDRYNNALLNGLPIPSTNPDLKIIPLDIFPSDIVKNLDMSKTASGSLYGDFAGATVNIMTKDYAEDPFFSISVGSGYNTATTGNPFKLHNGGGSEFFGLPVNGRSIPAPIADYEGNNFSARGEDTQNLFSTSWTPEVTNAMMPVSLSLAGGSMYDVGEDGAFGFIVTGNFDNKLSYREGNVKTLNAQAAPLADYDYEKWSYSTQASALANVYFKLNNNHSFKLNNLYVNTTENSFSEYYGFNNDLGLNTLYTSRGTYTQNQLFVSQLLGEHKFGENDKILVDWGASFSNAQGAEPDRKQIAAEERGENVDMFMLNASNNHRFWSDLNENEFAGKVQARYHLGEYNSDKDSYRGSLLVGFNARAKSREFEWKQINMINNTDLPATLNTNDPSLFIEEQLSNGNLYFKEQNDPSREFTAKLNIISGYAQYDYALIPSKLKMVLGARLENSQQKVTYKQLRDTYAGAPRVSEYTNLAILPSSTFKYTVNEKSNIRFAGSKTVTRPSFKELIPFQYQEMIGGSLIQGNPELINGSNYNFDLGYEIYPNNGELFSATIFGKYLQDPIEKVSIPESGGILYSFQNANEATAFGVEVELTKRLSNIFDKNSDLLSRFIVGVNASYMLTTISLNEATTVSTNMNRALQGASPYIINADLGYEADFSDNWTGTMTLTYSTFGDRIYATGQQNAGDIFEIGYGTLNFIWKNKIAEKWGVNLSVKNILNPEIIREQRFFDYTLSNGTTFTTGVNEDNMNLSTYQNGQFSDLSIDSVEDNNQTINTYKRGMDISLSVNYRF